MAQDIWTQAAGWLEAGDEVAMATIVRIRGSSSQPLGARMILTHGDRFVGSVSGGCVETDVYEAGLAVLAGDGPLMLHYKKVENPVLEIGLNCEGMIDVLVERLDRDLLELLSTGTGYAAVTLCDPGWPLAPAPQHLCYTPDAEPPPDLPPAVIDAAREALRADRPQSVTLSDGRVALIEPRLAPPLLWIVGAEPIAAPLAEMARIVGYHVVISDARAAFAVREKFPAAHDVIAGWPQDVIRGLPLDARTCVVSLNHEPRFEDALLQALADRPLAYLGAIGKPVRATERQERAAAAGFDLGRLPPIHTPIGLDIGGKEPVIIALSIMAEIVAVRNGRAGWRFRPEERGQGQKA